MNFDSYHWQDAPVDDMELARARARLASGEGDGTDFLALLGSDSTVAVGVALDQYHQAEAMTRFGHANPYRAYEDEVLTRARSVLGEPACLRSETGAYEDGANHDSALYVMGDLADPEEPKDREAIASAVRKASTRASLEAATGTAGMLLTESDPLDENLLNALAELILDQDRDVWERVRGIVALGNVTDRRAGDVLARAATQESEKIRLEVAIILSNRHMETHRSVVEEITVSWPDDAEYPRSLVLDALRSKET
ncbi:MULTISPECIES: hypothetical protein [Streptomyces]|uniref:hypothetical protein n=1 Tax=Streptomyces TaxID=1883 RepID=UPI000B01A13B|nr:MULTISPECIES: hypothetical protein [Streptomyces]